MYNQCITNLTYDVHIPSTLLLPQIQLWDLLVAAAVSKGCWHSWSRVNHLPCWWRKLLFHPWDHQFVRQCSDVVGCKAQIELAAYTFSANYSMRDKWGYIYEYCPRTEWLLQDKTTHCFAAHKDNINSVPLETHIHLDEISAVIPSTWL